MLVLEDVRELVRDRHSMRGVHHVAAHVDLFGLGVVVGERSGLTCVAVGAVHVDAPAHEPEPRSSAVPWSIAA